jgi:hypothetical protein
VKICRQDIISVLFIMVYILKQCGNTKLVDEEINCDKRQACNHVWRIIANSLEQYSEY